MSDYPGIEETAIEHRLRKARGDLAVTEAQLILTCEGIRAGIERAEDEAWLRVYGTDQEG